MEPAVNFEETPAKLVGKIPRRTAAEAVERMVREFHSLGLTLPFPRGVYRFKTFEEADEWSWKHMMAAAKKKLRARPITEI